LHQTAFLDVLALRFGWFPLRAPSFCSCGSSFSVEHILSCRKYGLPSPCQNDIRDLTASLLTEVCSQVTIEPELQPVGNPDEYSLASSNTQDGAHLDVAMNAFWGGQSERCFIDGRVFNHFLLPINLLHFLLPTGSMKASSFVLMVNRLERWNMLLLHLLFYQLLGE